MLKDKTLRDNNRRDLNLMHVELASVLPDYFLEDYPQLLTLLDKYYDWMADSDNPSRRIQDMYRNRDITQVEEGLLQYIEDELLLGQSYFSGFINKREAAKYSNLLYRSKGTLYSIQQFFRAFYGIDPDVIYTKNNVFIVGESHIGAESNKFLTNAKLYQTLALLIRVGIPYNVWSDVYKLFAHPAGMYVGAEVQLVSSNEAIPYRMPELIRPPQEGFLVFSIAFPGGIFDSDQQLDIKPTIGAVSSVTVIVPGETPHVLDTRQDVKSRIDHYLGLSYEDLAGRYSLGEFLSANSITFDDSNATGTINGSVLDDAAKFSDSAYDQAVAPDGSALKVSAFDQDWFDSNYQKY